MAAERQLTVRLREYQVMALHRSRSVRASESVSRRSPRWRRGAALSHAGAYVGPYRTAYTRQAGSPPGSPRRADRRLGARFLAMEKPPRRILAPAETSKNSKANRIETGERSGGIGEICSVEVDEK